MSTKNLIQQLLQLSRRQTIFGASYHHVYNLSCSTSSSRIWPKDLLCNERNSHITLNKDVRNNCTSSSSSPNNGPVSNDKDDAKEEGTIPSDSDVQRQSYLEARRKGVLGGRRRLSPLQRVGGMISSSNRTDESTLDQSECHKPTDEKKSTVEGDRDRDELKLGNTDEPLMTSKRTSSQSHPLEDNEFVIITRENLKRQERLMQLVKLDANLEFKCKFGNLLHEDMIGHPSGSVFLTGMDIELLVRRPSLEEFVLYMKRTPVIAYPKDCCTMTMMIDASPGDVVLEAGSGSGAMTLFLSRAVGHSGHVFSFEKMETHQKRARKNFEGWARSWNLSHRVEWPQNVSFHPAKLQDCAEVMGDLQVDGAIIDMEEPWHVMKTMSDRLKLGKAMAVYVANLTQVIEIAEAIRKERLPLVIETTLEVSHKVWVVNPARRHAGNVLGREQVADQYDNGEDEMTQGVQYIKDERPKYLTRPHHIQPSHTAFLLRIRKIRAPSNATTFKV